MEKKETKRRERREKEELLLAVDEQGREARERGRRDPSHPEGRTSSRGRGESLSRKKATKKTCHRGGSASIRFANVSNFLENTLHRTLSIVL